MTIELQKEYLSILDALMLAEKTIPSLRKIRTNQSEIDCQIEAVMVQNQKKNLNAITDRK